MKNKLIIGVIIFVILVIGGLLTYNFFIKEKEVTLSDAERFAKEYTEVSEDNVFQYRTASEIINILESGTGIVYFGFPECPWCQSYVVYLQELAEEIGIEKIYYYNILADRSDDSENYKKIVSLIGDYLESDDEGNPRIYVPDVTFVKEGVIIGHDNETAKDTLGFDNPSDYWTTERVENLKNKLTELMKEVNNKSCTTCN